MVCKHCGYQNSAEAKFCSGCGRKLVRKNGANRLVLGTAMVCFLIAGIGIGFLIPKDGTLNGNTNVEDNAGVSLLNVTAKKETAEIDQVIPMEDGSVAVLYTDGTVKVSGNTHFSEEVSDWSQVTELYYTRYSVLNGNSLLAGLTESGSVLTTEGNLATWTNVKKLLFTHEGIIGVTNAGNVLCQGEWEDDSFLTSLTDVEDLIYADIQDTWGCLKKDGSVYFFNAYWNPNEVYWNNVKELRDSGHGFYAIMKNGTIEGQINDTYEGLRDAIKVVDYEDWVFGISADGRLLTHNGGNIYTNTGDMVVDVPGLPYYGEEVDIRQFDQVKDIVASWGLILLNEDGTADAIGEYPSWDLSDWDNIEKVCEIWEYARLYGVRQDGSVIMHQYDWRQDVYSVTDQYQAWKLQDIYAGNRGVVGLTQDGKLVGDGIYENTDFSVFDR